ncbi:ARF guanine-nucleotide exchange factor GNOM-like [Heracleum sosnowskyi]|uniref:ARF guanine-nucleotide exchange factor GNOM-like n=1 Tax=Heracleum sosnowskyi TaxID=360622 RepID=A0AAD8MSS7_9APIA|nr:ARF guanine-nucleotide exchange factor GNOM-like [Heracleum sosnowskyi]
MGCLSHHPEVDSYGRGFDDCSSRPSGGAFALTVNSEISAVLAVMRRNVRWGGNYMADEDDQLDHSLIHSFKQLRKNIFTWQNHWRTINPVLYIKPFLDVIQSDETSAPITGVALSSVYKILTLEVIDLDSVNVDEALHLIVDAVTSCRFEVTDPASEEVVLMKILQVLLACMKSKAAAKLSNQQVCNIVNTCFRVVHQASSKGELLQRIARHTMHELIRCVFTHLSKFDNIENAYIQPGCSHVNNEVDTPDENHIIASKLEDNGHANSESDDKTTADGVAVISGDTSEEKMDVNIVVPDQDKEIAQAGGDIMTEPYGVPCVIEIFQFLCSLLNVIENIGVSSKSNPIAYDEDVPLFALGLINSAIELSGASIQHHPKLLALIQDDLFYNLTRFGLSMSPLILSTVCSIVLNLYHHLRTKLKLQLEAFFSSVLLRIAKSKYGASYQQEEVAMETLVDLCRQPTFMSEMYVNYDCDISCSNVFEDLANLLSKSAFPVNRPLSAMHVLALDGLCAMIHSMAERIASDLPSSQQALISLTDYQSFWRLRCNNYDNPDEWVPFVHKTKFIKRKLMIGAEHFNRNPKKGLEYLQEVHLLPEKLDPQSVACFFRFTTGLDKNHVGDYLGSHDDFCIQVLQEFAWTFDFEGMNLDIALRVFLETFKLPGESQKIQRVLEAFAERYYEQSPHILCDKDAALVLSYSIILLNTDQHNAQVKKKMTEEDFIRNNRRINGGNDLPREYLSELYHSISENEIRMTPEQATGSPTMTQSHWVGLMHKSKQTAPFISCGSRDQLDPDMFAILSGPAIAALSVVFDNVVQEDVIQTCVGGFLGVAKIAASYHFNDLLNDLVVSLCKFTTLMLPLYGEESVIMLGDDIKARMATEAIFAIANRYGDYIRSGWKNILDCVLSLHKLDLLPARLASDATDDLEPPHDAERVKPASSSSSSTLKLASSTSRRSSSLMGRFSQLLSFDTEEPAPQPSEEQLAAHQLVQALISAAGRSDKGANFQEDEETAVFCLELLIAVTLNNRDRIMLLWQGVYEHITNVVQSAVMPCTLVEKAVFGLLRICQRLLPYKENLTDELLKSLQLVLKLDARVADAYCEHITQEVMRLVKANAMQIRSHAGWRTITSLLSITARHPEASEVGFETLEFIMADGAHLLPANYVLCINASKQFAESRVGNVDRSLRSLDLMSGSVVCLVSWSSKTNEAMGEEAATKMKQDIGEMWLRLVQGLRKVCLDPREKVRNHAIMMLQRSLTGVDGIDLLNELWLQCFDQVIFTLLDDLLEIAKESSPKDYRNMEGSLVLSLKLLSRVFLQLLHRISQLTVFSKLWLEVLNCFERFMKVKIRGKRCEKIHEIVPELLKNNLLVMKTSGILVPDDDNGEESLWQLTWLHVKDMAPSLQLEIFPVNEMKQLQSNNS